MFGDLRRSPRRTRRPGAVRDGTDGCLVRIVAYGVFAAVERLESARTPHTVRGTA
ncbi:hypothetical protein [Streptomyces sp. H51]|uniref:hypothetical protein n=1 Tax=Streptomyces sp. H51 TaxID=3111770 RepID=UPI002D79E9E2|nr:hypothetical protein [Streptomyces sp. H51]